MSSPVVPNRRDSRSSASSWSSKISAQSCSSRPIRVDLPSSTDPQVRKRSRSALGGLARLAWPAIRPSEIALALLALHRGVLVAVDQPALPLGAARVAQFGEDFGGVAAANSIAPVSG